MRTDRPTARGHLDWTELNDSELVALFRDWDIQVAFFTLEARYRARLQRYARWLTGSAKNAARLVDVVFTEAELRIRALPDPTSFSQWLFALAQQRAAISTGGTN